MKFNKNSSFPYLAGYVEVLKSNSLDFEEFLWTNNVNLDDIEELKDCFNKNKKVDDNLRQYMIKKV
ncbi:MAG: hypothetical protein HDR43_00600 [Mycoplasma sp.]|nr:hypothetical protein [Mycoplasma sp.]